MTQYPFSYNLVKRLKHHFLLDVYMKYAFEILADKYHNLMLEFEMFSKSITRLALGNVKKFQQDFSPIFTVFSQQRIVF